MTEAALRPSASLARVYLYRQAVDFRKSHWGLSAIVEQELDRDPFSGELYVFTNRRHNKLKILLWEEKRFCALLQSASGGEVCLA